MVLKLLPVLPLCFIINCVYLQTHSDIMGLTFHLDTQVVPLKVNCVFVCVADPLYAEYLGCDAVYQNVLDRWTGWNW